jgi:hypothetical protein
MVLSPGRAAAIRSDGIYQDSHQRLTKPTCFVTAPDTLPEDPQMFLPKMDDVEDLQDKLTPANYVDEGKSRSQE